MAAEHAVANLTPSDHAGLAELLDRIDDGPSGADIDKAHMEFHRRINRAGASRRMRRIIGQLLDSLPVRTFDFTHIWIEGTQREHRQILELIRAGDAPGAAIATRQHFETGGERVIAALVERNYWSAGSPTERPPRSVRTDPASDRRGT